MFLSERDDEREPQREREQRLDRVGVHHCQAHTIAIAITPQHTAASETAVRTSKVTDSPVTRGARA